jgi:hypothetical protein
MLLNGNPFKLFSPSRGLRQGDPLSHFLFIIGTKVISHMLHQSFRGFKIARSCSALNHILCADDLVIFTIATSSEAIIIKDSLNKYSSWSGQIVNVNKSNIFFSKSTASSNISAVRNILRYQITSANAKHLGLSILYGKSRTTTFSDILDKVNVKIEGWRFKTLFQAGKSTLIKQWSLLYHPMPCVLFCSLMVFVKIWIGPLKFFGGVSQRTKPATYHSSLENPCVCQKIRVALVSNL